MKKHISMIASLAAAAVCCFPAYAAAPAFSVTDASGKPGDKVTVRVEINDNPGIIAFHLLADYDSDVLSVDEVSGGIFTGTSFGPTENDPLSFLWSDPITKDHTDNGTIAELTFLISPGAAEGEYPVSLSYRPDDVFNFDMDNVAFETKQGKITVTGASDGSGSSSANSSQPDVPESVANSESQPPESLSDAEKTFSAAAESSPASESLTSPDRDSKAPDAASSFEVQKESSGGQDVTSSVPAAENTSAAPREGSGDSAFSAASEPSASDESQTEEKSSMPAVLTAVLAAVLAAVVSAVVVIRKRAKKG